jgi:hypothetical protein
MVTQIKKEAKVVAVSPERENSPTLSLLIR